VNFCPGSGNKNQVDEYGCQQQQAIGYHHVFPVGMRREVAARGVAWRQSIY